MSLPLDPHQYTLNRTVSCCGVGLHSGRTVNLSIKPAPVDNGIRFFHADMQAGQHIKAHMDKVVNTTLATTLGDDNYTVATTEHLLAALHGYGIDNVDIELDASEVPIMDGSAEPFLALLEKTGRKKQAGYRKLLRITQPITHRDGDRHITITPYDGFRVTSEIDFDDDIIQNQKFTIKLGDGHFARDIARARTFGYAEQVEELWANGMALGGTLENVIAIHWNRKSILNEDGLRYEDEFIRHKVLDLIGDLALLGCQILGHVSAYKTGHTQHLSLMKAIVEAPHCWQLIECTPNGSHAVIDQLVAGTKAAGEMIAPFFARAKTAPLTA